LNKYQPKIKKKLDSFFSDKIGVMEVDSLESSHPINTQVNNPNEINSIFNTITYDKGSSMLRMLTAFLGVRTFTTAVSVRHVLD
jgi:aminopeptidase 2